MKYFSYFYPFVVINLQFKKRIWASSSASFLPGFGFTLAHHLFMTQLSLANSQTISIGFNSKYPYWPLRVPLWALKSLGACTPKMPLGLFVVRELGIRYASWFLLRFNAGNMAKMMSAYPMSAFYEVLPAVCVCVCVFAIFWMAARINNGNCNFSCMHIGRSTTILLALWKSA